MEHVEIHQDLERRGRTSDRVLELEIGVLRANPAQARREFPEAELQGLAQSIARNGILQPLAVREAGGGYELIAGERRLRAAKIAGFTRVPCLVYRANERASAVLGLMENVQRQKLGFFEEAEALARLMQIYGLTQADAARQLGCAQGTIGNKLRLLRLSEEQRTLISRHGLSERHARALLRLPDDEMRAQVLEHAVAHALTVAQTEEYIVELALHEQSRESVQKRRAVFQNVKMFTNTLDRAVETMQAAGIAANCAQRNRRGYVEYRVKIPVLS